uniref:Uncharacterized protein n=1 Tax=viral metagenome TaxID=1070528 RepID=A0A6M3JPL7_9ZZZZ
MSKPDIKRFWKYLNYTADKDFGYEYYDRDGGYVDQDAQAFIDGVKEMAKNTLKYHRLIYYEPCVCLHCQFAREILGE